MHVHDTVRHVVTHMHVHNAVHVHNTVRYVVTHKHVHDTVHMYTLYMLRCVANVVLTALYIEGNLY